METLCENCAGTGSTPWGRCVVCPGYSSTQLDTLCVACARKLGRCQRCRMDLSKMNSELCNVTIHLKFGERCGGCDNHLTVEALNIHETIPLAKSFTRAFNLTVHQWLLISLHDTGTTGSQWKVSCDSDAVEVNIDDTCIGILARTLGRCHVKMETDSVDAGEKYSIDFKLTISDPA